MANSSLAGCPGKMAVARDADGRDVITVRSARVGSWRPAVLVVGFIALAAPAYSHVLSDPRFPAFAYVLLAAWAALALWLARNLVREIRGWDRITLGADALTLAQRGAWRTRRRRVQYDNIVDLQVEIHPQRMPDRRPVALLVEPPAYRVVLRRHGGRPIYLAHGFGHSIDAASWLTEQIRRGIRRARHDAARTASG